MQQFIKDILKKNISKEEKDKLLNDLIQEIEIAKGINNGIYKYCSKCDDYYLSKSFTEDFERKETSVCTYSDPINSSGNEYAPAIEIITYSICPKGHKKIKKRDIRR